MQSKRDQLQAHSFIVGRLRSAVLRGDADADETPTRRFSVAAVAGVVVGVLVAAGFAVYGLVVPGHSTAWREPGTLVVERETGSRYVLDGDTLRPVLNVASARLLLGERTRVESVPARALEGVPRGHPVGIPGAPDRLPQAGELLRGPWSVCTGRTPGQDGSTLSTTVLAGESPPVVTSVDDRAVLVAAPGGDLHLLWREERFLVAEQEMLVALGLEGHDPLPVTAEWLSALGEGPELGPPEIPDRGAPGPELAGLETRVGQLLAVPSPGSDRREHYLVLAGGLAPVTPVGAAMVLADPVTAESYPDGPVASVEVPAQAVTAVPRVAGPELSRLPEVAPELLERGQDEGRQLCLRLVPDGSGGVEAGLVLVDAATIPTGGEGGTDAVGVRVPGGHGVLARAAGQAPEAGLVLVDELGTRYVLESPDDARALGFAASEPVTLPPEVLGLLPVGPPLRVADAARPSVG